MDHIGSRHQEADLGTYRQYQWLVDFEQVMLVLGGFVMNLLGGSGHVAEKLHVLAQVLVMPFPLIAGDLNVQVRLAGIIDIDQRLGCRNGHRDQDQQRHDGPENLHRGAFVEASRDLAGRTPVDNHRPEHGTEDHDTDDHTDPENDHVQIEYRVADLSRPRRHIHSPGGLSLTEN
ncbi:hypothetical protein D3C76_137770 [compost metagenome]